MIGYKPKNKQPEINKPVLMRSMGSGYSEWNTFVGYLCDNDGPVFVVGDNGLIHYNLMEDIEWWSELPIVEVEG
jgi:hypothetical protein